MVALLIRYFTLISENYPETLINLVTRKLHSKHVSVFISNSTNALAISIIEYES